MKRARKTSTLCAFVLRLHSPFESAAGSPKATPRRAVGGLGPTKRRGVAPLRAHNPQRDRGNSDWVMANELLYLRQDIQVEPLVDQWYSWSYLVPPATTARHLTHREFKIMDSYLNAPQ